MKSLPVPAFVKFLNAEALAGDAVADVQQVRRHRAAKDALMAGDVVGMGMGNEGPWLRGSWIEPEIRIAQVQAGAGTEADFRSGGHEGDYSIFAASCRRYSS